MTQGIQAATVLEVGPIMAEAMGLDWCRDRKEVVGYINKFREHLYLMYPDLALFTDKFYCLEVSKFPIDCGHICERNCGHHGHHGHHDHEHHHDHHHEHHCGHDCGHHHSHHCGHHCECHRAHNPGHRCGCGQNFYDGVTIPNDIDGVMAVWEDHQPLRTYSKWWEARAGIEASASCPRMAAILMPETFATERALRKPSALHFYASSVEDEGKKVIVKAATKREKNKEFHVTLLGDGVAKIRAKIHAIHSIVLPAHLCGTVSLTQDDGYELSEYHSYAPVPTFRRMKISTPCPSGKVLLQGSLKFLPVFFDPDIVEVGSRLIVEAAGRMFRYGESGTEAAEMQRASLEENRLKKLLYGAVRRQRGKAIQEPGRFSLKLKNASARLPGYDAR